MADIVSLYFLGRKNNNIAINTKAFPHTPLPQKKKNTICKPKISLCAFLRSLIPEIHSPSPPRKLKKELLREFFLPKKPLPHISNLFFEPRIFFLKLSHLF